MEVVTPSGFRDVLMDEASKRERVLRSVQDGFAARGYELIETPTLENAQVMQMGARMELSSFKFFDGGGTLVTMRPDVTLQVARICATRLKGQLGPFRFRYSQRIFRETGGISSAAERERTQVGVECIGESGPRADAEVIELFARSLEASGVSDFKISLATVSVLRAMLASSRAPQTWIDRVLEAFHLSDFVAIDQLTASADPSEVAPVFAQAIGKLASIRGGREAIDAVRALAEPLGCADGLDDLRDTFDLLAEAGLGPLLVVDFSVMSAFDYYTGAVFEAFCPNLGASLGGGGRYDDLLAIYGDARPAAGFAFFLEDALAASEPAVPGERPLRIAVPKGSLYDEAVAALGRAGLDVTGLDDPGRSLIVRNSGVEYVIVRPTDAPVFVELGAADCGICGADSLIESEANVVKLADLRFGSCRFVVAQLADSAEAVAARYRRHGSLRVATKYPGIAAAHFARAGTQVEIVKLHGNIELGPLTGLSECIVDITATGATLRENNLVVVDEVLSSTARFFANDGAFRTDPRVRELAAELSRAASARELGVTAGSTDVRKGE